MRRWLTAALLGTFAPAVASAEHDMASMSENHHPEGSEVSVGMSLEAAQFDTALYVGSYQGVTPSLSWMRDRFGASAALGLYHLTENGRSVYGPGDAMFGGSAAVITGDAVQAGASLHLMLPTGSEFDNLGMGHMMAMPALWASWHAAPLTVVASAGYGRALISLGGVVHNHGLAPLVDPMNLQELTWTAAADVELGHGLRVGGRTAGGVPIGNGQTRATAGGRLAWGTPRVTTALEIEVGLAGDPFTVRGVLDTALRF